ncbi:homeobox protein [Klebsormidium nitens]|uniref:Homeobox protein n=1 Tax=Klebsormidium nitens TaxID=105231 RepID=A0A1Y1I3D7_KLENI|nr:homeobox protein [Klebsormidium nitens]|eukprot:GAQ82628.1 homeobox protein [Klebsormidium nitens]
MEEESISAKPGLQAGSLPPDLPLLVHDIECNQSYPKLIAAHVACVQMDTSSPRLYQLELDLAAAHGSIGAEGRAERAAPGLQAAAPEVDAFMAECLAQLGRLKAALESHISAALRSCEVLEQRLVDALGHRARPPATLSPQVSSLRSSPPQPAADRSRAVGRSRKAADLQGPLLPASLRKVPSSTGPGARPSASPHPAFPALLASTRPLGEIDGTSGLTGHPRGDPTGRVPPAAGRDVGFSRSREPASDLGGGGLSTSTAMLVRRCLQRDAQLGRAEWATESGPVGASSEGRGARGPEPAVAASMAKELRHKLKKQYSETLAEVHKEILRKRQAGRLPGDQGHLLKDWWRRHESWPYPTVSAPRAPPSTLHVLLPIRDVYGNFWK